MQHKHTFIFNRVKHPVTQMVGNAAIEYMCLIFSLASFNRN